MKYFSADCVSKAYAKISEGTKDKFWGILAILQSIDYIVKPNVSYNIDAVRLSAFLENTFRFKDKKSYENSNSEYSVVFSSLWIEKTFQNFLNGKTNIYPIIVWAYRRCEFEYELSASELLTKFITDFHISKEAAEKLFTFDSSFKIEYIDTLYDDIQLLKDIKGEQYDINKTTLKMGKDVAVANAGDLSRGPFFQPLYASLNTLECLTIYPFNITDYYSLFQNGNQKAPQKFDVSTVSFDKNWLATMHTKPLQQIYFGTPGTGKSFAIDGIVNKDNSVRTTFHPDSDYSTFVGCYKPVKQKNKVANVALEKLIAMAKELTNRPTGDKVKHIIDFVTNYASALCNIANTTRRSLNDIVKNDLGFSNDTYLCEVIYKANDTAQTAGEITYEFVPQAFTTAYVNAWKNLDEPYYLVIEEINRGNCAQIFGDIFQLLDRDSKTGNSSYKITPDKDLQDYLATALKDCDIDDDIKSGEKMQLPRNLNVLATMNTSDQSLFPIDSAFKRRWDWKYIPIDYTDNGHYIACGSNKYKWTDFLDAVNKRIESVTQSEDKKMGGWFVKPNGKEITADKFVSKVVFYLWNDVFKDFGHDGNSIFKEDFNKFHKFFDNKGDVKFDVLEKFLVSLGLSPIVVDDELQDGADNFEADYDETIDPNPKSKNDNSKYSINGSGVFYKGEVAFEAVKAFAESHTELTADEVIGIWTNLGIGVSNLVISEETYNRNKNKTNEEVTRFERRFNMLTLNDGSRIYVTKGFTLDTITQFKDAVNKQTEWNIHIERIS